MSRESKQKPVAVFDIDGTVIRSSLVIELTGALIARGIFPAAVKQEFANEHQNWLNRRGRYEDYLKKLVGVYEAHTTGLRVADIAKVAEEVAKNQAQQTYRYTRQLIERLTNSHFLLAISGSPIEVVEPFARTHGFAAVHGTVKKSANGLYIDERQEGFKNKDATLNRYLKEYDLTLAGSIGVGDTESDASFLHLVDQAIAFNPNSRLLKVARDEGWKVVVERKDVVYELNKGQNGRHELQVT